MHGEKKETHLKSWILSLLNGTGELFYFSRITAFASVLFTELCSSPSLVIAAVLPAELLKFRNTSGRNRGNGKLEGYRSLRGVGVQEGSHNLFPSQSEADAFTSVVFELCWWFQAIIWSSSYCGTCINMGLCSHVDFLSVLVLIRVKDLHRVSQQEYNLFIGEKGELQKSKSSVKSSSLVYSEKEIVLLYLWKSSSPHLMPTIIAISWSSFWLETKFGISVGTRWASHVCLKSFISQLKAAHGKVKTWFHCHYLT